MGDELLVSVTQTHLSRMWVFIKGHLTHIIVVKGIV